MIDYNKESCQWNWHTWILATEHQREIDQYEEREKRLRELAASWSVCTWGHYQNPGIELRALINEVIPD